MAQYNIRGKPLENRDIKIDRAAYLFEHVKTELLRVLQNAPEYGSVGIDVVLHQGVIARLLVRTEVAQKLVPGIRAGGACEK